MRRYILTLWVCAGCLQAQVGAPASNGGGAQAQQLPLSGRAALNGSVNATETPIPGTTSSVNTLNTTVQTQGPFAGSRTGGKPFSGKLSLREAVERGVTYNLGTVGLNTAVRQAHGQMRVARSALLPNLNGTLREMYETENLQALGLRINLPISGFKFPTLVGPFNYFDLRATLTQTVADMTALNNYKTSQQIQRANEFSAKDARDLVVLAVGGAYLQTVAAQARVEAARASFATSKALYQQTVDRHNAGLSAQIDVNRAQVQQATDQQRITTLLNDLAKQKINLARLTGLPPTDTYELTDLVPYTPGPDVTVDDALRQAFDLRPDLKAADAQLQAAERSKKAARSERLPSLALQADYGSIGVNPPQAHGTYTVVGTLRVPIWQGGKVGGDIEQADAALEQRRAELEDTRGRIESEIRNAFLDLQAAASQVKVAESNRDVAKQTLELTRQRFEAGITDPVEVVQAQEGVASADLDYISAVFAHNLAKLSVARAMGQADQRYLQFLNLK